MVRPAFRSVLLALTLVGAAGGAEAGPPGFIRFEAENVFSTANGTFHDWRVVRAEIDRDDPASGVVEVEVDVASLDTGSERRDEHLRSADFFEVERWPTAHVRVHGATPDGEDEQGHPRYRAKFDLRIRDTERTVEGTFSLVSTSPPTVEGDLILNRVDFGVGDPYTWWVPGSIREEVPVRFRASFTH